MDTVPRRLPRPTARRRVREAQTGLSSRTRLACPSTCRQSPPQVGDDPAGSRCVGSPAHAAGPTRRARRRHYFGYEDRYRTVYENGAQLWESEEPNASLLQMIDERPDVFSGQIIDLGCGEGRDSLYLLSQGHDVVSVDVSHSALARARERAAAANLNASGFVERDVIHLRGFDDNGFDLAMNMGCLHMLVEEEQRGRHISRVYDILRPGGHFIVDHCASEWGKGFFSIPDYTEIAGDLVPGNVISRRIRVADSEKEIGLEVLPFSERSGGALAEEITRHGFSLVSSTHTNTEAFGSSTMLLFRKPTSGKQTS
ncbi:class I SAM-dependent methyltransferase [Streptomyces sp. NPDC056402]|uniref:class I SAM-dependent methyltransferase n=1 Tax=Streptomyces sp. NPDC056402 TaxID=3345810 RepID=UPI0035DD4613